MAVPKLPEGQYDLVLGDAFNDLSVPYHLTTKEFNEQIRVLLKYDGIYAVNVVDKLHSGRFLRAYVNTLQRTFPYVYIIRDSPLWEDDSRKPQVVVGSFQPLSSAALREANTQAGGRRLVSHITPDDTLTSWLNARENILLTDDYAPVDNLIAPIHLEKHALSEAAERFNAGLELVSQGKLEEAIIEFTKVIEFDPNLAKVYYHRGAAYAGKGEYDQAIADFTEAIEIDPEYADVYFNRGLAYKAQGKKADAIADFVKFITLTDNQQWVQMAEQQIEELEK